MKRTIILLAGLFFSNIMIACTFIPESFCSVMNTYGDDLIVSGRITGVDDDGVFLEIIDVLRGQESATTIRIWDGTDFDCNGPFPMHAGLLGDVNDELVIILPKITEMENTWDVIGDYRMPNPYMLTTNLSLNQGVVNGLIRGDIAFPSDNDVFNMSYETFKSELMETGDCSNITSTDHFSNDLIMTVQNPFKSDIVLSLERGTLTGQIQLFTLAGDVVADIPVQNISQYRIDMIDKPSGVYLMRVLWDDGGLEVWKLVKG